MRLRPYQRSALDRLDLNSRPVLVAPTGSGKTCMAAVLVRETQKPTLWLAHRRELIHQAAATLRRLSLDVGVIMAGTEPRPALVQVASIQTLARRAMPPAGLVVLDECHHATAESYKSIIEHYADAALVGLTATPFRTDGAGLGDIFGSIVVAAYTDDLCADGTLVEPIVYAPDVPDLSGVRVQLGDYDVGALGLIMSRPRIVGDVVASWCERARARRTVVFAVNISHSEKIVAAFRAAGVRAEHLDGGTANTQRDATLARLRSGETTVVSNCQVLGEGWDLPALEVAVIARPTASLCLHLQQIGRIMRAADGKAGAIVLDHAGNHFRHGPVTERIEYSLDGKIAKGKESTGLKRCPGCFLVVPSHCTDCPECAHVFKPEAPAHAAGSLVPFAKAAPVALPPIEIQQQWWDSLESQREARGYAPGWTWHRFRDRFGFKPNIENGRVFDPKRADQATKRSVYQRFVALGSERGYKAGWAAFQYRSVFGVWPRGVS